MPYVKLDTDILNSTIWFDHPQRDLFITALLMADPYEVRAPEPQLRVTALEETGWTVPPGWYGFVAAAGPGIAARAGIPWDDETRAAMERLSSPEPESRSREFDGRRLARVNGGWIVLNYFKYRDKDYTSAIRSARYRARKLEEASRRDDTESRRDAVAATRQSVTEGRDITQAEAEAYAEAEVRTPLPPKGEEVTPTPKKQALVKALDDGFDRFWRAYPLKKAKVAARRSWAKHAPDGPLVDAIVDAVEQQKTWRPWREGFIPLPTTWLNQERWNDEPEPARENPKSRTAGNKDALARFLARRSSDDPE